MRIKKVLRNLISEVIPQIVIAFIGIFKSKIFLDYLGENTVGLYQLFTQVLGYLSLVEGGLASAVTYRLYKPVSEKNYELLSEIKNGVKKIFRVVILIIVILGIGASFVIPFLIKDNTFSNYYILLTFMLFVISEVILYTTVFERSMFTATEQLYKLNIIYKTTLILKSLLEIIIAIFTKNLIIILCMFVIINLLSNLVIISKSKKEFYYIFKSEKSNYLVLKDVKNLLVHKIAVLISSNVDIVLVSKFIGIGKVVIYSTYMLFCNTLTSLLNKISNAFLGSVGNIIIENKKDSYRIFKEYNSFIFFIAMIVGIPFMFSIDYFINIWYNCKVETSNQITVLVSIILIYNIVRIPLITFTEAAGLFRETKKCPIIESIVNLILSLILVQFYGIAGLLFATFISFLVSEFFMKPKIIFDKIFEKNVLEYYKFIFPFIFIIIIELVICYFIKLKIQIFSLMMWFIISCTVFIINAISTIIIFIILKQNFIIIRLKQILNLLKKTKSEE